MSCPALRLTTSPKQKRNRFSPKFRSDGQRLAELLRETRNRFPHYAPQIDETILRITRDAQRTRGSDRDRVVAALKEWREGLGWKEIMEDTGLSRWDVRQILYDLIDKGIVEEKPEPLPGVRSVWWRRIYRLKG
jgi:hypothetical protein